MDREWSTSALAPELQGWDWFALQLDDGRDLMFYRLRGADGGTSPFSGGSLTDAAGLTTRLGADDIVLTATREWTSPATSVRYPVAWRLSLPREDLELALEPRLDRQELDLSVRYWEGAISVSGRAAGRCFDGVGYVELAGY
jgi:predicted secreted hydrolase